MESLTEGSTLKKYMHPSKGCIIAFNQTNPHTETTYYQLKPFAETPDTLEEAREQLKKHNLRQIQIRNKGLLRSLNYPEASE